MLTVIVHSKNILIDFYFWSLYNRKMSDIDWSETLKSRLSNYIDKISSINEAEISDVDPKTTSLEVVTINEEQVIKIVSLSDVVIYVTPFYSDSLIYNHVKDKIKDILTICLAKSIDQALQYSMGYNWFDCIICITYWN